MTLSVAIQHHPARAELLPALLEPLAGADVAVVPDPEPDGPPSAWRTYRACLELELNSKATHLLVVQDDVLLCDHFLEAAQLAICARPDRLLSFFVGGLPSNSAARVRVAAGRGQAWALLDRHLWIPTLALVWPVRLIRPALEYVDAQRWPARFRADDEIIGRAARALGEQALASAPSLVEHPDVVPSLTGKKASAGRNLARVAACFIGDCDPRTIDWDSGAR